MLTVFFGDVQRRNDIKMSLQTRLCIIAML